MAFDYIRQVEIEGQQAPIPVGHFNISTFRSTSSKNVHMIKITDNNSSTLTGAVTVECYSSTNKSCCNVTIPVSGLAPDGKYYVDNRLSTAAPSAVYATKAGSNLHIQLNFTTSVWTKMIVQSVGSVEIVEEASVPNNMTPQTLQHPYTTLIENVDYGTTLPSAGNKGRIFFVKV